MIWFYASAVLFGGSYLVIVRSLKYTTVIEHLDDLVVRQLLEIKQSLKAASPFYLWAFVSGVAGVVISIVGTWFEAVAWILVVLNSLVTCFSIYLSWSARRILRDISAYEKQYGTLGE